MHLTYLFKNTRFELNLFPKKKKSILSQERRHVTHYGESIIALKSGKLESFPVKNSSTVEGDYKVSGNCGGIFGENEVRGRDKKGMSTCNRRAIY